jgi:hypothetical protein
MMGHNNLLVIVHIRWLAVSAGHQTDGCAQIDKAFLRQALGV